MRVQYEYKNLKNNQKIKVDIDKNYTFIYGPNGTGKTTFSRSIGNGKVIKDGEFNKIHLVFNQDFVNNNIYVSTSDGSYKSDTKNKSKLKQIFLGDSSKDDNEKLSFIRQKIREYNKIEINPNIYKNDFKKIAVNLISDDENYIKEYENYIMQYVDDNLLQGFFDNVFKKIDFRKIKIDSLRLEEDGYANSIELGEIEKTYTTDEVKEELIGFYKLCHDNKERSLNKIVDGFNKKVMSELDIDYLREKANIINVLINNLDSSKELYEIVSKLEAKEDERLKGILDGKDINIKNVKKWIDTGDSIHEKIDFNSCLYCKNTISDELKNNKTKLIQNKYLIYLNEYKKEINEILEKLDILETEHRDFVTKNIYTIVNRKKEEQFFRIIMKRKNYFKNIYLNEIEHNKYPLDSVKYLNELIGLLENGNKYLNIIIKEESGDKKQLLKAYQLYLQSDNFNSVIKRQLIKRQLVIDEERYKKKIKNDTQEYIGKIKDYIQEFEDIYEPRFDLVINSNLTRADTAETTLEITSEESNFLNHISEGEKNILALIIFFSYVKNVLASLKDDEQIVLVLDDPVNSNDWGNFFKFQAIIEDYFYKDVMDDKKISNIILLSHNIDYAVIQLENDKYGNHFEFIRLFSDKAIKIDTSFLFMDDIKLGSKLIHELYESIECIENKCYIDKHQLYRTAIYMRKFLESFLNRTISIANPDKVPDENKNIKFIKENIDSTSIDDLLNMSTKIMKEKGSGTYSADNYMKKLTLALNDITDNTNLFTQDSKLMVLLNKYKESEYSFFIKGEDNQLIIGPKFEINEDNSSYDEVLIDIMIKGLVTNINEDYAEKVQLVKAKAQNNYLKYMRHVNDNVGRPVLAVNSDNII